MRISDWSSDVCSSDLDSRTGRGRFESAGCGLRSGPNCVKSTPLDHIRVLPIPCSPSSRASEGVATSTALAPEWKRRSIGQKQLRSEEHTSELQSLMRISYAAFCLKQ